MKFNKLSTTESSQVYRPCGVAELPVPRIVLVSSLGADGGTMSAYLHASENVNESEFIAQSSFSGYNFTEGTNKVLKEMSEKLSSRTNMPEVMPYRVSS